MGKNSKVNKRTKLGNVLTLDEVENIRFTHPSETTFKSTMSEKDRDFVMQELKLDKIKMNTVNSN
jgi:hypothetical protein